jgi:predicted type IV restriction endonuclease
VRELLTKIGARLDSGAYINEASVRIGIIEPILASLGWDTTDPLTVIPEYSSEGRRVDYALCAFPARPSAFIEAKAVGKVEAADRQLFEYAFHEGVPFAVLTDGRSWSFYLPSAQGSYEDRRLYKLDLQEREPEECERVFTRYLAYGRLRSGEAQSDAQKDYASRANERMASDTLKRAWSELLAEPDPFLIDLLVERTEALCGIRPSLESAETFLLGATGVQPTLSGRAPTSATRTSASPVQEAPQLKNGAANKLTASFRGRHISGRGATAAFLEVLRALATEYPERIEQIATAAKGRKRNHVARTPEDVYPDRPDLTHTVVELVPGWFVGTNIANREKHRIIKAACGACGIRFGTDVIFELPNT